MVIAPSMWLTGVVVVGIGFLAILYESWNLLETNLGRLFALTLELFVFILFVFNFVVLRNSINFQAVASGSHGAEDSVSGIQWDSHLTDLQIAVINPTDDELNKVDFTITPNAPVYRAAIENDISDCRLSVIPGGDLLTIGRMKNTTSTLSFSRLPLGDGYNYQDDHGTIYTTLLTNKGYRLICSSIPSHFSLRLVFAVGQVDEDGKKATKNSKTGQWAVSLFGLNGSVEPPLLDSLGPRPRPGAVHIEGTYNRRFKPFTSDKTVPVSEPVWPKPQ